MVAAVPTLDVERRRTSAQEESPLQMPLHGMGREPDCDLKGPRDLLAVPAQPERIGYHAH